MSGYPPACMDCKHFRKGWSFTCNLTATTMEYFDVIHGVIRTGQVGNDCRDERAVKGSCGPEGKLWEAKDEQRTA